MNKITNLTSLSKKMAWFILIEIKKSAKPTKSMSDAFDVLDKEVDKKHGTGAIVCLYDSKLYLKDDFIVLPIEYI